MIYYTVYRTTMPRTLVCIYTTCLYAKFRLNSDFPVTKFFKGSYWPFCMFEPDIFNFHTCNITDNHFPEHTTGTAN
ncbi:hypothetical protein LDENG_00226460 [Lucifuga dentata]|nr:hypothetical protein LDENG_00226460 [Lucifuga dentata]